MTTLTKRILSVFVGIVLSLLVIRTDKYIIRMVEAQETAVEISKVDVALKFWIENNKVHCQGS